MRGLMNSRAPISGLDSPSRASRATWGLLRGQHLSGCAGADGRGGALAGGLTSGPQLAAGPFGEGCHAHLLQHPVGDAQLLPRVGAAALPAQPFPVQEAGAGQLGADPGPA